MQIRRRRARCSDVVPLLLGQRISHQDRRKDGDIILLGTVSTKRIPTSPTPVQPGSMAFRYSTC